MTNQHLFDLYTQHESKILEIKSRCNNNDKMNGPFLIAPNHAYQQAAIKVAFIGQETNGWSNKRNISEQMATYSNFNLAENYKYRHGPFWSVIRKIETALTGSIFSSAWLNLNRYDQDNKAPSIGNQLILSELDFLLVEELKLIAPDVVIFLTGPHYDQRITRLLQGEKTPIDGYNERKLCQIKSQELTGMIFRTYHPNYLRRASLEKDVIEAISAEISRINQNIQSK